MMHKIGLFLALCCLAGCSKLTLLHELDERDANEIIVLLDQNQIQADKEPDEGSGNNKGPKFKIDVASNDANHAWKVLTDNQLPRKKEMGYGEVFSQSGLVPTAAEEKAKMLQAVTGELARTLKSIDGVLDARVHVVIPEENAMKIKEEDHARPTASVWFKYVPAKLPSNVTELAIQELVAHAIENLDPKDVKVIQTSVQTADDSAARGFSGGSVRIIGMTLASTDATKFKIIIGAAVLLVLALTVGLMLILLKLSAAKQAASSTASTALSASDNQDLSP